MSALGTVPQSLAEALLSLGELASYALLFVSAFVAPRAKAAASIVALSSCPNLPVAAAPGPRPTPSRCVDVSPWEVSGVVRGSAPPAGI